MKKLLLPCLFTTFYYLSFSQGSIKGLITDKQTNEGLPGATVAIQGSEVSTISDNDGFFLLPKLKTGTVTLKISYVGYQDMEIQVDITDNNATQVNASLTVDPRAGSAVIITASNRREKIINAPASIKLFGVNDFNQFAGSNTNEMVSQANGIQFLRSGVEWIYFNARNFNSGGNLKVLQFVDGRLNRAALSLNLPILNMGSYIKDDIERLEIVFGPQAALYGPNAINAVFNTLTKDPKKYQGTTVSLSAGNHYQFSGRLRHAEKIDKKWAYKLNGEYAIGREYVFYDSVYVDPARPTFAVPERNVDFDFRHIRGEGHIYYSLTPKADIILSGGAGNNNLLQPGRVQLKNVTHGFIQLRLAHPRYFVIVCNTFGNIGNSHQISPYTTRFWRLTQPPVSTPPDQAEKVALTDATVKEESQRLNADAQYNYSFQKAGLFFIAGINYQLERPNGFGRNLLDSFQKIRISQYGAVTQLEKSLRWTMRLIGAVRYDHHSNFGNFFSPKIGIIKSAGDHTFRITWGQAYSMPNILSQYANVNRSYFGNGAGIVYMPNGSNVNDAPGNYLKTDPIKPEEIKTWEFGYKGVIAKKLFVDITYYFNKSINYIGTQTVGGRAISAFDQHLWPANSGTVDNNGILSGASFSCNFNYGQVKSYGIDANLNYSIIDFINLTFQYSWFGSNITDDNIRNDANGDGYVSLEERSLNTPRHRGIIGLNVKDLFKKKMYINISSRFVQQYDFYNGAQIGTEAGRGSRGKVYWEKSTGQSGYYLKNFDWGPLGGFISFDLSAGYKFNEMINLNMGVTNLLNTRQIEAVSSPSIGRLIMFELKMHVPNSKK